MNYVKRKMTSFPRKITLRQPIVLHNILGVMAEMIGFSFRKIYVQIIALLLNNYMTLGLLEHFLKLP
jgi:hypothetical protein